VEVKSILVPLSGAESDRISLETASRVARLFSSHINAVHVQRSIVEQVATLTMGAGAISQEVWDTLAAESRNRETSARKQLDALCRNEGFAVLDEPTPGPPTASWQSFVGVPKSTLTLLGRFCDLLVVGREAALYGLDIDSLGEILLRCGRPMLIASSKRREQLCESVAVAWKDTAQSAHALTAARPFLARARKVFVLQVKEEPSAEFSAQELVRQLRWGNCDAELHSLMPMPSGTTRALLAAASSLNVDLLVAGGYGHSRAREFILGGVTRDLLENCPLPVLMTH
jgi:nucleotide-binding universal stress UspA family protein